MVFNSHHSTTRIMLDDKEKFHTNDTVPSVIIVIWQTEVCHSPRFLDPRDNYHLSDDGTSQLAATIRSSIDTFYIEKLVTRKLDDQVKGVYSEPSDVIIEETRSCPTNNRISEKEFSVRFGS